ncbi:hypothetical protein THERMOS_21 [Bathymodiolus thermophilus thioautotrophic gill symbiont]|uniref:Uncharacterized protein n=1 Tax=Bathymodiolus thermophilus thioautotrophic gill symbiont TaxID=2360 RepID=A0A8H8XCK3_9GAMM|nr:hypothetical protein THERMOS_21 [Bathymodiolus thermophilus thioautotrophic gill symbiont]
MVIFLNLVPVGLRLGLKNYQVEKSGSLMIIYIYAKVSQSLVYF